MTSIHQGVDGPSPLLSFGDMPWNVRWNHVHTELVSDNLLEEARDLAKLQLFGNADNNVQYCKAVKAAIIEMGHSYEFLYSDHCEVIRQLCATVVWEELKKREARMSQCLNGVLKQRNSSRISWSSMMPP
jgi:hypothetical protein